MQQDLNDKEKLVLNTFADILCELRRFSKKSQRMLAFENGLQKSMISRFEAGCSEPKMLSLWKLSNALNIKPSEFLALIEKKLPQDFNLIDD